MGELSQAKAQLEEQAARRRAVTASMLARMFAESADAQARRSLLTWRLEAHRLVSAAALGGVQAVWTRARAQGGLPLPSPQLITTAELRPRPSCGRTQRGVRLRWERLVRGALEAVERAERAALPAQGASVAQRLAGRRRARRDPWAPPLEPRSGEQVAGLVLAAWRSWARVKRRNRQVRAACAPVLALVSVRNADHPLAPPPRCTSLRCWACAHTLMSLLPNSNAILAELVPNLSRC